MKHPLFFAATIALLAIFSLAPVARAEVSVQKQALVKEYIDLYKSETQDPTHIANKMVAALRLQGKPEYFSDEEFETHLQVYSEVFAEVLFENLDDFYERLYPIYDDYFSEDDLKTLLQFYKTPVGQKVIETMSDISLATMQETQMWITELNPIVEQRVLDRLEPDNMSSPPQEE